MRRSVWMALGVILAVGMAIAVSDSNTRTRIRGVATRERFIQGMPVSYWVDALRKGDAGLRIVATQCLSELGPNDKEWIPTFKSMLANASTRSAAAQILVRLEALPEVTSLLGDPDRGMRKLAAQSLAQVGTRARASVPALKKARLDADAEVREAVSLALWRIEHGIRVQMLGPLLSNSGNSNYKANAESVLPRLDASTLNNLAALIERARNGPAGERLTALFTIGRKGEAGAPAVPALIEILQNDEDVLIRQIAALVLGAIGKGARMAENALAASCVDPAVKVRAREALAKIVPSGALVDGSFYMSTEAIDPSATAPLNGRRFETSLENCWLGRSGDRQSSWQVRFRKPRTIGAILQIHGDHDTVLQNAPRTYVWQGSNNGRDWKNLEGTEIGRETRTFRIHRLRTVVTFEHLRILIKATTGTAPVLREVEFYEDPEEVIPFPSWIVAVDTTGQHKLPGKGASLIGLARSCSASAGLLAQETWLGDFNEAFISAEPHPLCAFLSGNFVDWCQQDRRLWRGMQEVLMNGRLPIWASCGGAQGLAILSEYGTEQAWDCPHCRDPRRPKTPLYTHIGHTASRPCGDYSCCLFERGPHRVHRTAEDPAFDGLDREFMIIESHCGQIERPPRGWVLVIEGGKGTKTRTQCIRVRDRPIYAAQFHIEMPGAQDSSNRIMRNFLSLAERWGGYNLNTVPWMPASTRLDAQPAGSTSTQSRTSTRPEVVPRNSGS